MPTATRTLDRVARGHEYAVQAAAGNLPVCRWVRLAAERHLRDLEKYQGEDQPFFFDASAAERVCEIVELFPHIRGVWAQQRRRILLEPWQCFILSAVFGWMATATNGRRFRIVYIEIPRKNAKSTLSSAVGLYLTACDGEQGAHVVSAASALHQAKIVFTDAQLMARREKGFLSHFGVEVLAHAIVQQDTASRFEALSAEYSNLDGLNLHAAIIDELHAHSSRELWDVLATATASRLQPLLWAITTAGVNRASVCYDQRTHLIDILEQRLDDESYFGIIYTKDDDDDPWAEETWAKANPNYGISVLPEGLRSEAKLAMQMPSAQAAFLTKHLDVWVNAAIAWLPPGAWDKCADPKLDREDFRGKQCYIGIDLALRSDIAALVLAFPPDIGRDWWAVFGRFYLPEDTVNRSENAHYQSWELTGHLIATPKNITDFDMILDDLENACTAHDVIEVCLDPWDAGPLVVSMQKRGLKPPVEIKQSAANLSPAMVEMEGLVLSKRVRHDGDPVLAWMQSNVRAKRVGDLIMPTKDADERKIDGITALLMCVNRGLRRENVRADYENRGLWLI